MVGVIKLTPGKGEALALATLMRNTCKPSKADEAAVLAWIKRLEGAK